VLDRAGGDADPSEAASAWCRSRPSPRFVTHPQRAPRARAPATVARRTAAIRSFCSWCYKTRRLPADPAALLRPPRKRGRVPRAMDRETAERALAQAGQGAAWPERDALVIVLALVCGLRLEEVARLRVADRGGTVPGGG